MTGNTTHPNSVGVYCVLCERSAAMMLLNMGHFISVYGRKPELVLHSIGKPTEQAEQPGRRFFVHFPPKDQTLSEFQRMSQHDDD